MPAKAAVCITAFWANFQWISFSDRCQTWLWLVCLDQCPFPSDWDDYILDKQKNTNNSFYFQDYPNTWPFVCGRQSDTQREAPKETEQSCCVSHSGVFCRALVSVGLPEGITPTGCLLVLFRLVVVFTGVSKEISAPSFSFSSRVTVPESRQALMHTGAFKWHSGSLDCFSTIRLSNQHLI